VADSITWSLTANTSSVAADMGRAVAAVNAGSAQMVQSLNRADAAHTNLLKSPARVAHQISSMSQTMLSGADATTTLVQGLDSLERSLKLPLGSLAGLAIGAVAIKSVADYRDEWTKLIAEMEKAGKLPAKTTEQITARIAAEKAAADAAKEKISSESWWGKTKRFVGDVFGNYMSGQYASPFSGQFPNSSVPPPTINIKRDAEKKIVDAKNQQADDEQKLADLKHAEVIAATAKTKLSGLQFTLADLAKEGREWSPGDDSSPGAGRLAKRAMALEAKARKAMLGEHYDEAFGYQNQADRIKNSIVPLKDNEKDLLNAIERAEVLKAQLQELRRINFGNR
jgi:hypothetical protein